MKKIKKIFLSFIVAILFMTQPFQVMAESNNTFQVTREYLDDGSFFEILIESNENQRSSIKNASKTFTFKSASKISDLKASSI